MTPFIPETMKAAAFDRYGGPEVLKPHDLPVPKPKKGEVLSGWRPQALARGMRM